MHATAVKGLVPERRPEALAHPLSFEEKNGIVAELARLLESRHFRASRRCSDFLDYIVRHTLNGNWTSLKERALGVELFNRPSNYDTNSDPVVRATAGEVRKKIAQHYQDDRLGIVQIVLPVGTYVPRFEVQTISANDADADKAGSDREAGFNPVSHLTHPPEPTRHMTAGKRRFIVILSMLAAALVSACVLFGYRQIRVARESARPQQTAASLETFWRPFVLTEGETVAVFSEVSRHSVAANTQGKNHPVAFSLGALASPGISGVGEVAAVHALDGVFSSFHRELRLKRGNFFTFDDAARENVVFLGSPLANPPMRILQNSRDFVFQIIPSDSGPSVLAIVNNQPLPGESKLFLSTPGKEPIKDDYAVIALLPGIRPGKRVLVLAGITTFGTQAAAEFVSQNDSLKNLISHLKLSRDGELEPFEAVISIKIDDEVPVEERIVALHLK